MNPFDLMEPKTPDYYADLGLQQWATARDIKLAFFKLARLHHPDKKAPGKSIDAQDFRKVREAYECLTDKGRRAAYDSSYFDLRDDWDRYREWQDNKRKYEDKRRADEKQRVAREKAEKERRAAEAEQALRAEEEKRAAREKAEHERIRKEKIKRAEERSQEAARKAREQQEQAAKERIRREKAKEAERRSEESARKVRIEQEQAAQERLKNILIEEKQNAARRSWTKMREEAERRGTEKMPTPSMPSQSAECAHPQLGWLRKNGAETCTFCGEFRRKWCFHCPECSAAACPRCKVNHCIF
ncbi:DnaJ-domain-containing protein [Hypoxylon fuscum]|nr:DnaJ-domain-containing protein [Hypoxylon fuscum]